MGEEGKERGREMKGGEGGNDLTHPLLQIPDYATGSNFIRVKNLRFTPLNIHFICKINVHCYVITTSH